MSRASQSFCDRGIPCPCGVTAVNTDGVALVSPSKRAWVHSPTCLASVLEARTATTWNVRSPKSLLCAASGRLLALRAPSSAIPPSGVPPLARNSKDLAHAHRPIGSASTRNTRKSAVALPPPRRNAQSFTRAKRRNASMASTPPSPAPPMARPLPVPMPNASAGSADLGDLWQCRPSVNRSPWPRLGRPCSQPPEAPP